MPMHQTQKNLTWWKLTGLKQLMLLCLLSPYLLLPDVVVSSTEAETETSSTEKVAEFSLPDLQGSIHTLADYNGKVVLVNFWASWCVPCVKEMPELTQLKLQLANQPFEILALNVGETKNRVKQFTKLMQFNLPVLLDTSSEVFNSWEAKIMPSSFLLDAKGRVRQQIPGNPGWDNEQIISLIKKLIKETM